MEKLEYLIRTLTYKRSVLENQQKEHIDFDNTKFEIAGKIDGINIALDEIWTLIEEIDKEND